MKIRDAEENYGLISVLLHWLVAAIIVTTLAVAIYADGLARDAGRSLRFLHMSLGLLLTPLVTARIIWRLTQGKPATKHHNALEGVLANVVWRALLLSPIALLVTGPFLAWLHERPIAFFELFQISSPVAPNHALRENIIFPIHAFFGYLMIIGITLHITGALKHLFIYRDGVADRMLRPFKHHASGNQPEK